MALPQSLLNKEAELNSALPDIDAGQTQHFSENGKYMRLDDFNGDPDIYCTEYVGPQGAGYIVYARAGGFMKAIDKGPEERSFDWTEYA
jgi:hypothetical protein